MGRRGLPDRWIEYNPIGERIVGTSFIAFKVPLKETMVRNLPENERFTTQILMESVPNIGLVIDLTNTDRYYDCKDFLGQGVRYEKIFCRGHEIPSQSVVDKFFSAVDKYTEYLQSSSASLDDEKLIGVHCTHGLNRTGYLVCRYMIRRLGFSPEDAIAAFEKARGYPMEREEYLKNLREDENCAVLADSGVKTKNSDVVDVCRNNENSSSCRAEADSDPNFGQRQWTDSAPSHSWDARDERFSNLPHSARVGNFQRFSEDVRSVEFGRFSQSARADKFSWHTQNSSAHDFSNFATSRNASTFNRPHYWEFDPEERVSHNSPAVSRRTYERYHEENAARRRPYDHQPRSASSFSDFRQVSPWRHHRTEGRRYFDHSV